MNPADTDALDRALSSAELVRIHEMASGQRAEAAGAQALGQLRQALRITGLSDMDWMSADDVRLEFFGAAGTPLASIGFAEGGLLRWQGWDSDAELADSLALLQWLAAQGIANPLQRHQQLLRERQAGQLAQRQWEEAIPPPIATQVPGLLNSMGKFAPDALAALTTQLHRAYPGPVARISRLLSWNGAGSGLRSGFPSYEAAPAQLLAAEQAADLIQAVEYANGAAAAGAARYLGGWEMRDQAAALLAALSPAARARVRDAARDESTRQQLTGLLQSLPG